MSGNINKRTSVRFRAVHAVEIVAAARAGGFERLGVTKKFCQVFLDLGNLLTGFDEEHGVGRLSSVPPDAAYECRYAVLPDSELTTRRLSHRQIAQTDRQICPGQSSIQHFLFHVIMDRDAMAKPQFCQPP